MALINCPKCGNKVSDKARMCPKCGSLFAQDTEIEKRKKIYDISDRWQEYVEDQKCKNEFQRKILHFRRYLRKKKTSISIFLVGFGIIITAVVIITIMINHNRKTSDTLIYDNTIDVSDENVSKNISDGPIETDLIYDTLVDNPTTRKQIEKNIETLEKQIEELEKKKTEAEKKDDELKREYRHIFGNLECSNPFIVYDTSLSLLGYKEYCWIVNPEYIYVMPPYAYGYVKATGNYNTWNGITCAEYKAYNVPEEYVEIIDKCTKEISKKETLKNEFEKALDVEISGYYNTNYYLEIGEKGVLPHVLTENTYNRIIWKSNNPSIVTVNEKGVVEAVNYGSAIVTVETNICGKIEEFTICVEPKLKNVYVDDKIIVDFSKYKNQIFQIPCYGDGGMFFDTYPEEDYDYHCIRLSKKHSIGDLLEVEVRHLGIEDVYVYNSDRECLKIFKVIVTNQISDMQFSKEEYVIDYDEDECGTWIGVYTNPKDSFEPIIWQYDPEVVRLYPGEENDESFGYNKVAFVELLSLKATTITAVSQNGISISCRIIPKDIPDYHMDFDNAGEEYDVDEAWEDFYEDFIDEYELWIERNSFDINVIDDNWDKDDYLDDEDYWDDDYWDDDYWDDD